MQNNKIQPDWWSKSLAGSILGLTLAFALSGCFAWFGPGGITADSKVQFNMWIISPIWMLVLSFCFLFRSGKQAWLVLGCANLIFYSILYLFR
ncbi:hypothetical protein N7931_06195 [Catenovulum sp. 2E275]|uniref:hypothetical protein n=1 Tax=Catenovulum sp. 2E275 TaxID=2980497 RepID=UPI0021CF3742|nr:hypothetical protein [Catenovulum sp. 2E275]MCU4675220.1 hypothetical protein [Catenovulum sp. 2E275]